MMTVSRALRNAYGISPKTRDKVIGIASEMGYVPNKVASNLAQRRTQTIGVVLPDIAHSIFPELFKSMETVLGAQDYRLFLTCSYDQPEKEFLEVIALLERRVDGIIIAPVSNEKSRKSIHKIKALNVPLVLIDRIIPDENTDSVAVTDFQGAFEVVTHLIDEGFQNILHFSGPDDVWTSCERKRGFEEAMQAAGRTVTSDQIIKTGFSVPDGIEGMKKVLAQDKLPDAIFCANDPVALGAFKILRQHGIAIPDQIALAGFSDIMESSIIETPLTTVRQDTEALGREAAKILLSRLNNELQDQQTIEKQIPTELIIRASSLK